MDASPGATVGISITGIDDLHRELNERRTLVEVWGPAIWVPYPEEVPWGVRLMTISDPFGNHLRFSEPLDQKGRKLPRW